MLHTFGFIICYFKPTHFTSIKKQLLTIYANLSRSFFLGTTPVLGSIMWANENAKVVTRSRESKSRPSDCEADALSHVHGQTVMFFFIPMLFIFGRYWML